MDRQKLMNDLLSYRKKGENPPFELVSDVARSLDMSTGALLSELTQRFGWPQK